MACSGRVTCVGIGMTLGAHMTERVRGFLGNADIIFIVVSDPIVEKWVEEMYPGAISLQPLYAEGKSRKETYAQMVLAIMSEVRNGKKVCCVFYGHPGVFAWVPHRVVELSRREGFQARMEPGISAADCLYADLGIDPGRFGCQHYEATQLLIYRRVIDVSAYLILWQVGLTGDLELIRYSTDAESKSVLSSYLTQHYPEDHEVILYEAATLPIVKPRMDRIALQGFVKAELSMHTTMVIPPAKSLQPMPSVFRKKQL